MKQPDISVLLTLHNETLIAGPTIQSAERAIARAEEAGLVVERLMGFDSPSEECRIYFSDLRFDGWHKLEFDFRDQGQTRTAMADNANGRWIAFLDGDDLFSENWLACASEIMLRYEEAGEKVIVHPELNWIFDASQSVLSVPSENDSLFTFYYLLIANYYDAMCLAPREAYLKVPFAHRDIKTGFAYEDWQWAIETLDAGYKHVCAKDTIIFKRRRDSSQTIESTTRGVLIRAIEQTAIDQLPFQSAQISSGFVSKDVS